MKTALLLLMALPLAAQAPQEKAPPAKPEPWLTGTADFGYRWVGSVGGDLNTYRSVVNLGDGPKLFSVDLKLEDPSRRLFDRLEVRGSSWGGDPYNTARIDARREGLYEFTFDYRNVSYFNFLPSFADPTRERGFFLNQRAFDTFRRSRDFRLDLFPGRRITPYFAYQRNMGRGSGITNIVLDANEYPVRTRLYDRADDYRGGFRFQFPRFHLTLEQGGINFADDQSVYAEGRNNGNVTAPVLDQRLFLASGTQLYHVRSDSLYSRAMFTANPVSWADLYGQFLYSRPHSHANLAQQNTGNFVSFSALAFYTAQLDAVTAEARQPHSSSSFSAELRPLRRVRVVESWMTDRLHNAASALLTEQLLAGGRSVSAGQVLSARRLVLNYSQQQVDVIVDVDSHLTLRVGHRYVWGDAEAPAGLLNQPFGADRGRLRRHVALAGVGARFGQKFRASVDFEASPGDRAFFRTSLNGYQKARARARYQVWPSLVVAATLGLVRNQNPSPGVSYDFLSRDNSASLSWAPAGGKLLSVLAEYSRSTIRSDILYLVPSTLGRELSYYRERAHAATAVADFKLPGSGVVKPKLSFGGSLFASCGSRPARYYQPLTRMGLAFKERFEWNWEWRWYALSQPLYLYEGFRSHQFVTGLRVTM